MFRWSLGQWKLLGWLRMKMVLLLRLMHSIDICPMSYRYQLHLWWRMKTWILYSGFFYDLEGFVVLLVVVCSFCALIAFSFSLIHFRITFCRLHSVLLYYSIHFVKSLFWGCANSQYSCIVYIWYPPKV